MRPWSQAAVDDYLRLPLRAHEILRDVPVLDVWRVALPGGGASRTMEDVRAIFTTLRRSEDVSPVVRGLFGLRSILGRLFRWDRPLKEPERWSYLSRLSDADRSRSLVEPGTLDGAFTVLYVHAMESASELRNQTVHGFLVFALRPAPGGYELFWGIHVLPVSAWTKPYLAAIRPFRHWLVYPALLRRIHEAWTQRFAPSVS